MTSDRTGSKLPVAPIKARLTEHRRIARIPYSELVWRGFGMELLSKEWIISPPWEQCDAVAARWRVPPLVAQVLYNRGLDGTDRPTDFLDPRLRNLHLPRELPGAAAAAKAIVQAIRRDQSIVLYGDYDVDGMTGVAILWHLLSIAGARVSFYVPHRLAEGYGLNCNALRTLVADGTDLIVSVDCGVTAVDAARVVREAGATLIITDHHQPGPALPQDTIIVHPSVGGSYPNEHLCGAGVAFKLAWAIAQVLSNSVPQPPGLTGAQKVTDTYRKFLHEALALAALGTVADVVPLVGENRIIARHGLALLPATPFVGLRVLMESAGLRGTKVDGHDVGFKLAPRLNAAGRMGHARLAVELLTRATEDRAREIALYLEEQNRARQTTERRITKQACDMVQRRGMDGDACRAIVLAGEGWHAGVIGIVASRLVDRYHRPAVLIALEDGHGQGSARSVPSFDLHQALGRCASHLTEFGGHAMAAGLKIRTEQVPPFTEAFTDVANNALTGADLRETLRIDAQVPLSCLDLPTVEALTGLGPFGTGNPRPRLATDWVELAAEPRLVGSSGRHLQAVFSQGGAVMKAIAFGQSGVIDELKQRRRCQVAFAPMINEFNGRRNVEMQVVDFQFPDH